MFPALVTALVLHSASVSSYSAYSTTKAYDLQVPGSTPIRIIEADPVWDFVDIHDQPITEKYNRDLEHRTLRTVQKQQSSTTQHTKTTLGNPIGHQNDDDYDDPDELANSSRLKDFLEKYSVNKVKSKLEHHDNQEQHEDSSLESVEMITKSPSDIRDKSKAWNLNSPYHASDLNSFEQKKGWVSLEAVPWSVSKISKWHANNVKPAGFNDKLWNTDDYTYTPKPSVVTRPNGYNYDQQYQHQQETYRPPSFSKPTAVYGQKVHLEYTTNRNEHNKPWGGSNNNNNNYLRPSYSEDNHHQHTDDCRHKNNRYANTYGDVITDGQPPNFPETQQESTYNRRRGTSGSSETTHVSHPFNGDGEWVLLTTTKGYKYPHRHNRERSMQFNSALNNPENTNIVDAHKAIKLTVLPPAKGSRVNMTTSHGGLLQVESTFQTVDQAQKAYAKRQKIKQQKNKRRKPMAHKRKSLGSPAANHQDREMSYSSEVANYQTYRPARSDGSDPDKPDASTVLAAVGAGMIPATMALMVPMALNGKRRRRRRDVLGERLPPGPGQMMLSYHQDATLPRSI